MSHVLHDIEKQIIKALQSYDSPQTRAKSEDQLSQETKLSMDQIRRGVEWLRQKKLADVEEIEYLTYSLGKNGLDALKNGLPERRLVNLVKDGPKTFDEVRSSLQGPDFNAAIGYAKKNDWINIEKTDTGSKISLKQEPTESSYEVIISYIAKHGLVGTGPAFAHFKSLKERPDFIIEHKKKTKIVSLSETGKNIDLEKLDSGAIDVEADVPHVHAARIHPLKDTINEIRETFVHLGFTEILGNLSQSSFWNFDALFTPQDHPARELQDTFYLKDLNAKQLATPTQIKNVSNAHKKGWRYYWDIQEARKMVLRTHTTCVTIKHLADKKPDEARIFSLGRVFRNEKLSFKHLAEFNQVEGVVVGKHITLRDLMGIQKEFYRKIGLTKVKFWPTFFPYTEPSLQSMVYNEKLGKWIELFGMGIFRPEVTKPLGITKPVLAWGGGIERIAMLKFGLDDVREFYNNNLSWLRTATKCQ
uniref:phenylalanine--tRNA ligase n=1 Tax=uncultured marine thaumarchaeote KM3_75_F03 TaxID=1456279 RepID=A0A075HM62_9ARCH|nr:phenylalanyl-tRNA synthetase subunit alpha (FARSA, pheS) [uncultured marine thaumarchaeote KM3_75_F03]